MPRTSFHDFVRDNGQPVTVEYSATGGEPYADLPGHICDGGGSGPEIMIVDYWPSDDAYTDLVARFFRHDGGSLYGRVCRWVLQQRMTWARWRHARLTPEEIERIEAHLAESFLEDDYYEEDFREA